MDGAERLGEGEEEEEEEEEADAAGIAVRTGRGGTWPNV
jgi:hypothetical protein